MEATKTNNEAAATPSSTAVVKAEPMNLFNTTLFINTPDTQKLWGLKDIVRTKDQAIVGQTTKNLKRSEVAANFGLTTGKADKDKLDDAIAAEMKAAWMRVKAWLLMRPDNSTGLAKIAQRMVGKDNVMQTTVVIRDLPQREAYLIEKLAAAHGVTVEELAEFLAKKKAASPTVNVSSSVTSTAEPIKPAVTPTVVKK